MKELVEASETAEKLNASIIIPLLDFSKVLGFLTISRRADTKKRYSQDDFLLLSFMTDKIQTSLANIYANEKANVDVLTGLHNRRFLKYRLESEVTKSIKEGIPLSFIMMDVDGFKFFNDAGGHEEGDIVLCRVADMLIKLLRPSDECFRFAGDEFSMILPNTDSAGAGVVTERLKERFNAHANNDYLEEIFQIRVTLSIGVATYHPEQARDEPVLQEVLAIIDALEKQSDEGMYKSKNAGKNKVSVMPEFSKVKYEIDLNRKKLPLSKKDLNPIDPFDLSRFDPIDY